MSYAYFNVSPPVQRYLNVRFSGLGDDTGESVYNMLFNDGCPDTTVADGTGQCRPVVDASTDGGCPAGFQPYDGNCVSVDPSKSVWAAEKEKAPSWMPFWGSMTADMPSGSPASPELPAGPSPTPSFFPDFTGGSSSQPVTPGTVATAPAALPFWGMAAGAVLVGLGIGIMFGGDK